MDLHGCVKGVSEGVSGYRRLEKEPEVLVKGRRQRQSHPGGSQARGQTMKDVGLTQSPGQTGMEGGQGREGAGTGGQQGQCRSAPQEKERQSLGPGRQVWGTVTGVPGAPKPDVGSLPGDQCPPPHPQPSSRPSTRLGCGQSRPVFPCRPLPTVSSLVAHTRGGPRQERPAQDEGTQIDPRGARPAGVGHQEVKTWGDVAAEDWPKR